MSDVAPAGIGHSVENSGQSGVGHRKDAVAVGLFQRRAVLPDLLAVPVDAGPERTKGRRLGEILLVAEFERCTRHRGEVAVAGGIDEDGGFDGEESALGRADGVRDPAALPSEVDERSVKSELRAGSGHQVVVDPLHRFGIVNESADFRRELVIFHLRPGAAVAKEPVVDFAADSAAEEMDSVGRPADERDAGRSAHAAERAKRLGEENARSGPGGGDSGRHPRRAAAGDENIHALPDREFARVFQIFFRNHEKNSDFQISKSIY